MVKAFIFDMDGLLIDSEPIWRRVEFNVFSRLGLKVTESGMSVTAGMRVDEVVDYWYQRQPWDKPSAAQVINDIIAGVVAGVRANVKVMPGVDHALDLCSATSLPLAIASSSRYAVIDAAVDKLGIKDRFQLIKSAQDEPLGKPNPAIYISVAQELGVLPEDCLVFEDSLNGVIAAKAAKMPCVAVPSAKDRRDPRFSLADIELNSLADFRFDMVK
jgi:sugar-phosphatase